MNDTQRKFISTVKKKYNSFFYKTRVVEIGSLDINGSVRDYFSECCYVGVDIGHGPGVDVVCKGHEYISDVPVDVVISTECLEHDPYHIDTISNCVNILKPGGLLIITCAGPARPVHGTKDIDPNSAPHVAAGALRFPVNYYKNLSTSDLEKYVDINKFLSYKCISNTRDRNTFFYGVKA